MSKAKVKEKISSTNPAVRFGVDANGKIKPSPGRPKGVPNKITGQAKENIAKVFEGLGGIDAMMIWAKKNTTAFYCNVYTKLIPVHVQGEIEATIHGDDPARQALERILVNLLANKQGGDKPNPVIIESEPAGGTTPQLVFSSKGRSASS